jgi:hypothetical protein
MRRVLALAAVAGALAAATPAHAVIYPVCTVRLVDAGAGAAPYCATDNTPAMAGAYTLRVVHVEVLAGVAEATLTCGFGTSAQTDTIVVSGPRPQSLSMYENHPSCRLQLRALYDQTTAVATSTFGYAFY